MNNGLDKLLVVHKKHLEELRQYYFDLSNKNVSFVNALATSSATIGSFSLFTLQINQALVSIDPQRLVLSFKILLINSIFSFFIIRFWISLEERALYNSAKILPLEEELISIFKNNPVSQENKIRLKEITTELSKDQSTTDIRKEYEINEKMLNILIYLSMAVMTIGIIFLSASFGLPR